MPETPAGAGLAEYLTIGEAASRLGVSVWTLRNWDRAGKLKARRHPVNGHRLYRSEDLTAMVDALRPEGSQPPAFDWSDTRDSDHFVQFYESDKFLVEAVGGYVGTALEAGDAGIVIATPAHRAGIDRHLTARGLDTPAARAEGRLVVLDAADTLDQFMVGGSPDPDRFAQVVGGLVAKAARGRKRLRAFGEMVALLWEDGNRAAAIRLEELWNDLGKVHKFALFCAYPMKALGGEAEREPFGRVCACHTRVVPAEGYAAVPTADGRAREIARLQQRAATLEAEIARRKEIEAELRERDRRKDEFLATLGHELRNPLAPLRNALEILRVTGAGEQVRGVMERQVNSLGRMVDDLLQVSRVTRGQVTLRTERVDLGAVVRSAVETSRPGIDAAGHRLTVALPPAPLWLEADPVRLTQVFANLLNNAAKYTDDGGRIDLVVERQGNEAVVRVRDTGVGIPAEMLPRVFDLFTQVDRMSRRAQGGLGIGLALVKSLVGLHRGTVAAASAGPGQGSEFTVRLPLRPVRDGGGTVA